MTALSTNTPAAIVGPLVRRLNDWREELRRRRDYRRTVEALGALSDRELADVGVNRGDIRHHAKMAIWG